MYLITQEWLESQGVELSKEEDLPVDSYTQKEHWKATQPPKRVKSHADPLRRFLEYDGKVLTESLRERERDIRALEELADIHDNRQLSLSAPRSHIGSL
ncbi:jg22841 [Pararge aegeria aegeria]|uniref:Jg22841 protein n=1 Tax=Pararge aegeria aegeria TaxID=348720 RepID=A0A8S4QTJ6_9NEOP|nr:jg22841 [Pararge aegeria aegeria]